MEWSDSGTLQGNSWLTVGIRTVYTAAIVGAGVSGYVVSGPGRAASPYPKYPLGSPRQGLLFPMLRFCGFDLELNVEAALGPSQEGPVAYRATDSDGGHWLIVEGPGDEGNRSWVCAPASERAAELVSTGRAAVTDAVLHSRTGWVEVVSVVDGHAVPDHRVSCAEVAAWTEGLRATPAII